MTVQTLIERLTALRDLHGDKQVVLVHGNDVFGIESELLVADDDELGCIKIDTGA